MFSEDQVATVVSGNTFTLSARYDFANSKILGKGSFGIVCTALDRVRDLELAIKRIRPYANDEWDAKHTLREVRLLRLLSPHPNIITLYDLALFEPKAELYMMMEKMDCDLHRVIQSKQPLSERHYKCFMKQLLEGIKAMHSVGCFHRDLKPGNILVSKDCQLRITDFGLARFMDESTRAGENEAGEQTTYVVTRWYRCPELLLAPNLPYTEAVDLWSCGCILAELINRKPLLPGKDHLHQIQLIFNLLGYKDIDDLGFPIDRDTERILNRLRNSSSEHRLKESVSTSSAATIRFIEQLLQVNPSLRPSAEEALQSPFMDDVEVLHDYSRPFLRRPAPDFFEFETKRFSVAELKKMVLDEVANSKLEPTAQANSPDSMRRSSGGDKASAFDSSSADKYRAHQRDEDKGFITVPRNQSGSNLVGDDRSGPPSQLATVRAHPGHAAVDGNAVRRESKVHRDNPFKSSGTSSSQSNIVSSNNSTNTEKLSHRGDESAPSVTSAGSNGSSGDLPRSQSTNSKSAKEPKVDDAVVVGSDATAVDDHVITHYTVVDDVDVVALTIPHDVASRSIRHKSCCSLL